ncbi:SPOC like C-terminal domain-containing protein [Circinella umbellata]|nr:SPOC like C-terminal domain-containing protein [Circinella umbellata]
MSKKATVYILDSGPNMGQWLKRYEASAFQKSKDAIQQSLEEKLLAGRKTDQISLVIAGTEESDNDLAREQPGQYQHITVMNPIKQPDLELLRNFVNVPQMDSKTNSADVFDALILTVAMIKDFVRHLKYEKRIRLYTTLDGEINWDNIEEVNEMIRAVGIQVSIACLGLNEAKNAGHNANPTVLRNLENFNKLIKDIPNSDIFDLSDAIEESRQFHKKEVRPTPVYRGYLSFGDSSRFPDTSLSLSINMYARVTEAKVPSAKKWSSVSNVGDTKTDDGRESHQVVSESTYRIKAKESNNNNNKNNNGEDDEAYENDNKDEDEDNDGEVQEVEKSELEKAYRFGKNMVVVSEETEQYLKLKTDPSMTVIAIYPSKAFPPQLHMANVYTIVAGVDRPNFAAKAISAFAFALQKSSSVALVRYVYRANVPPKLAILKPCIDDNIEALYFTQVPFAEDYRDFMFNSLDKVITSSGKVITENHPLLPTQDARDAMSAFVKGMALKEPEPENEGKSSYDEKTDEAIIDLEEIYNPHIWLTQKATVARALNSAAPVPDLDPRLKEQFEPSPRLVAKNKENVENLKRALDVKKVDRASKKSKYGVGIEQAVTDNLLPVDQVLDAKQVPESPAIKQEPQNEIRNFMNYETRDISMGQPISDFNAMINNRNEDLVSSAVEKMSSIITTLVTKSFGKRDYDKAYECLQVLRGTAAKEDESEAFNKYMHRLKETCDPGNPDSRRKDFWDMLKEKQMTLISSEEALDSQVSPDEAKRFLEEEQPIRGTIPPESADDDTGMSNEDLLAMME